MGRIDVLSLLYAKGRTVDEFNYDNLTANPLLSYITMQDIEALHKIASSMKLAAKPKLKYKMIDQILVPRGFKKLASGTNRVVYKCLNDQSVVLKVAYDEVALKDNPAEYRNQFYLKPFCAKVFEVSPCGTVALQERVQPIVTREEYIQVASDVFDLLVNKILGKYVLDDIGTKYYQNFGLRVGFGPVILDYPYVFELDGEKLYCNEPSFNGHPCGGVIDYDSGFNKLICNKCGKQYFAWQLDKKKDDTGIVTAKGDNDNMSILIMRGNEVVDKINEVAESDTISAANKPNITVTNERKRFGKIKKVNDFSSHVTVTVPKKEEESKLKETDNVSLPKREERANENVSASSLGNGVDQSIFAAKEEDRGTVEVNASGCTTSLGSLIQDALHDESESEEEPKEEQIEEKESASEEPIQEEVNEDEEFDEEEQDNSEMTIIVESSDDYDEKSGTTYVAEIKPIKKNEIDDTITKVVNEYNEKEDLSDAY